MSDRVEFRKVTKAQRYGNAVEAVYLGGKLVGKVHRRPPADGRPEGWYYRPVGAGATPGLVFTGPRGLEACRASVRGGP